MIPLVRAVVLATAVGFPLASFARAPLPQGPAGVPQAPIRHKQPTASDVPPNDSVVGEGTGAVLRLHLRMTTPRRKEPPLRRRGALPDLSVRNADMHALIGAAASTRPVHAMPNDRYMLSLAIEPHDCCRCREPLHHQAIAAGVHQVGRPFP
jgi:hypothetical protein